VTGIEHYAAAERSAAASLARVLRIVASRILTEAARLDACEQKTVHAIRSDVRDLDHSLLGYEKAVAGLAAARVVTG
jgi:RNase P/RNase MRP subunit p30